MREPTLKDHIGYWINRLRMEVHQAFEARLATYDVTIAQWCILASLYGQEGESITELAAHIEVDKASISRVVERMKEKGLLTHKAGKDRRSGHVQLTREGALLVPQLFREAAENEHHFFGHLSEEEREQFRKIFCRIFTAIPSIQQQGWLNTADT